MKQGQFPAILSLASLNGQNGFKLNGENSNDNSGGSVSAAGDINGDGHDDLVIGAYGYLSSGYNGKGRSYVVFGGSGVGASGVFNLSNLTGANGFKLDGENVGDISGYAVGAAGDINGDGYDDLIIGAFGYPGGNGQGRSYVVFGGSGIHGGGVLNLSSLSGTNGFKLDGEYNSDGSGWSVSTAGDIDGDGRADVIIGANSYPGGAGAGRSYVVFGGAGVGGNGIFNLSSLTGANGFKLDGENNGDHSGASVSVTGDINGDGYTDLIIGADLYPRSKDKGRSYVVFGGPGLNSVGVFNLSSLDGANGFKLDGENNGDQSGYSVNTAGDINGDGYVDLLIGAFGYPGGIGEGRSYVVFGRPGVGNNGVFSLSSLNSTNGFKLDGENNQDLSGWSVATAGDINGDGYADLIIGAPDYPKGNNTGCSYVVFGGPKVGSAGTLNLSSLNGANGFKLDGENNSDGSGWSVSAVGDINGDGIGDVLIGAYNYSNGVGRSYLVFGDIPPILVNNSLSLSVGAAIQLNSTYLAAYDLNHNNNTLVFIPSAVTHGQFESVSAPGIPLVNFTQQQITSGVVQFVHDGTLVAPTYNITVRSPGIAWTGPLFAKIAFLGTPPSYFPAIIPLSSLNGQNGFKMDGEVVGDQSGIAVSGVGDVNGDGQTDLLIGANFHNQKTGRSYVVFGGPGVGGNGLLPLSSLNGANGFKLDGEAKNDNSGWSVSAAGDVNDDGIADLLIGSYAHASYTGRSYVVFGSASVVSGGVLALSSLNGTNGFKMNGEVTNDQSGYSVSLVGDINGDGINDLVIGAINHNASAGRSYVVYGQRGIGDQGLLPLSVLNGTNGFKLDGEISNDSSGDSVRAAGDINGDGIADLLIGAEGHYNFTGRSYVVFGGYSVGSSGLLPLASLNGVNGFKLDGETIRDDSGTAVSGIGDINADGWDDFVIGADWHNGNTGRSYVIFGGTALISGGLLPLSGLNGVNGFKLDGETVNDYSGGSLSAAGDINGDGVADLLITAPNHNNSAGRSYVVFGGALIGSGGLLDLTGLYGGNGFKLDGEAANDLSGASVSGVGDINGDGISDLLIGAYYYAAQTGRSYVVFGDAPPTLVQNRLSLYPGLTVPLNSSFLSAYDRNHNNNTLVFVPTAVSHGQFELVTQPGISLVNFTQPQLIGGSVRFVHDGSSFAPSYDMTVYSAGIAWTGPSPANITFIPASTSPTPTATPTSTPSLAGPVLLNNQLTLSNGQMVILSSNNLQASEVGFNNSRLTFVVGNVQNGYFSIVPTSNSASKNLTSFTQTQIQSGAIEFVHADNGQAPAYAVLVSDGVQSTLPSAAVIHFEGAPIITQNTLNITVGGVITLTPALLNVTATDGSVPSQVIITVSHLQHATITSTVTGTAVNNFTLADVQAGDIQLTDDGSLITPSYTITVEGVKSLSSAPNQTQVYFSNQGVYAPQLVNNYLSVTQGEATLLSNRYLSATQPDGQALDINTVFYISNINYGHFSLTAQPQTWLSFFSQEQLSSGQVQFVQDGSLSIPSYSSAVKAFGLQSASQPAGIFFTPVNEVPSSTPSSGSSEYSTVQKAIIGAVVSGSIGIGFAILQVCLKRAANRKLLHTLGEDKDDYDRNVVSPIARDIAQRIKITGFLNATTNKQMASFKSAVRSLLSALDARGVDLNLTTMSESKRDGLVNEIGRQVDLWVKANRRGCTACCPGLTAFFKPQLNPDSLAEAAGEIADSIVQARKSQLSLSANLSVSGSPVYQDLQKKPSVELGLVDSSSLQSNPPEEVRSDLSSSQLS